MIGAKEEMMRKARAKDKSVCGLHSLARIMIGIVVMERKVVT